MSVILCEFLLLKDINYLLKIILKLENCDHFLLTFFFFQVGKEMLSIKSKEGEGQSFNLLMELLRGDH